jgi:Diguanylate cyclase, GGDEF domain
VWLLYLLAGIPAVGGYFLLPSVSAQSVFYNLIGLSSMVAIIVGIRMYRPVSALHWYVLAFGMLVLNIGEAIFTFYESNLGIKAPFPTVADAFYLLAMPCFSVGLVLVHHKALARKQRQGDKVAVLFIDLDDFKEINDSLGHERGDRVLVAVAHRLRACLRPADTAARLGGDDFTVLLEDVQDTGEAGRIAERILAALRRPVTLGELQIVVSASIGSP